MEIAAEMADWLKQWSGVMQLPGTHYCIVSAVNRSDWAGMVGYYITLLLILFRLSPPPPRPSAWGKCDALTDSTESQYPSRGVIMT